MEHIPEETTRERDEPRRDAPPQAEHPVAPGLTPSSVLALQRSAGNHAVARVLAREPQAGPFPAPGEQRPDEWLDLETVREETKAEILLAFAVFCDACDANVTAMKAAAKANAEAAALFIDIATGFLAPAFAVAMSPTFVGRLTIKLAEKAVIPQPDEKIKELITSTDMLKAGFTGGTKIVSDQLKRNSTRLFGEGPEEAFLDEMKTEFQRNAVTLVGRVHNMYSPELLAVWGAYDAEVANINTYKATIKTLLDQFHAIESIGSNPAPWASPLVNIHTRLHRVEMPDRARLVVLNDASSPYGELHGFVSWVPSFLEEKALAEEQAEHGGPPPDIALADITGGAPDPPD
jgi:hypothetical protein